MKKPDCFGSNPNAQQQAENSCHDCNFQNECFNLPISGNMYDFDLLPKTVEDAKWGKQPFVARVADRKRGWGKFCSKSCKAIKQEARTGQCKDYYERQRDADYRREYGGTPMYDLRGNYVGFTAHFSNEEHDCNKD